MNSFEALGAFAKQLQRNIGGESFHTKVVVTPASVREKGVVIKVSLLKSFIEKRPPAARFTRTLRIRVSVVGTAESHTGLRQALEAIEALDCYLTQDGLRLEATEIEYSDGEYVGEEIISVPDSRVLQTVSQEDSFFDSPDSIAVQEVQDDRIVVVTIPQGG